MFFKTFLTPEVLTSHYNNRTLHYTESCFTILNLTLLQSVILISVYLPEATKCSEINYKIDTATVLLPGGDPFLTHHTKIEHILTSDGCAWTSRYWGNCVWKREHRQEESIMVTENCKSVCLVETNKKSFSSVFYCISLIRPKVVVLFVCFFAWKRMNK